MRMIALASALLLSLYAASSQANGHSPVYALGIDGLSCPFCAYGIEKELTSLEGVDQLATDIVEGLVTIFMEQGATLDEAKARKATEDAGFSLRSFDEIAND